MTETVELYTPKPGSMPWLVLTFLVAHPEAVLMRKDVAAVANCPINSVDAILQLAVVRGGLMKMRNNELEVTWRMGDKKAFRLDKLVPGVALLSEPAAASPPAPTPSSEPVDYHANAVDVEPETDPPREKRQYTRRVRAGISETPEVAIAARGSRESSETCTPDPKTWQPATGSPVMVEMPLQLTPELIHAVKNDPSTSFADKADGHHAIGWLTDAYEVMVKTQQKMPAAQ